MFTEIHQNPLLSTDFAVSFDSVGEIINRACNEEQRLPDLSLGNQFANTISFDSVGEFIERIS